MKSEDVARYLHDHPEFFDQYAEMLTLVTLPDPHSGRAISITEKQLFNLREKVRTLEAKLVELIGFGEENDTISDKVHGLAVALIAAGDHAGVVRALYSHLGGAFAVPHVGMRLWGLGVGGGAEVDGAVAQQALVQNASSQQVHHFHRVGAAVGSAQAKNAVGGVREQAHTIQGGFADADGGVEDGAHSRSVAVAVHVVVRDEDLGP